MTTLAHISDIHLAPLARPRILDISLKRLTGYVNWHRRRKRMHRAETLALLIADLQRHRPDQILVGGDLTNIGLPAELAAAACWLKGLGAPERITVVPGNHDCYVRLVRDPGITRWSPWMSGDDHPLAVGEEPRFPFVRRRQDVAIVALSSGVPTPVFMATGRLGAGQIEAAGRMLADLKAEGLCRVVLIHHPPLPGLAKPTRALADAGAFASMLARQGAELVVFGHNHRAMRTHAAGPDGPIPVIGVPAASATPPLHDPPARWNLFHIDRRNGRFRIELTGRQVSPSGDAMVEAERVVLSGG